MTLGIKWPDLIPNDKLYRTGVPQDSKEVKTKTWNWISRTILGKQWRDLIPNDKLYRRSRVPPVYKEVNKSRWKWISRRT